MGQTVASCAVPTAHRLCCLGDTESGVSNVWSLVLTHGLLSLVALPAATLHGPLFLGRSKGDEGGTFHTSLPTPGT